MKTPIEIRIKPGNELTAATMCFHLAALWLCWVVQIPAWASAALSLVVLGAMWREWAHAGDGGLRHLWLGPADEAAADVDGVLRKVESMERVFVFTRCASFILHCADGERIPARVFDFGVARRGAFRSLCRRLNTGVAW